MSQKDYRKQKFLFSLLKFALNTKDSGGEFKLPKKAIIKFDCSSNTSYQKKIRFCESIGLITKVREYYRQDRRARTYRINYNFAEDGELVDSLEDGLRRIFGPTEIRKRYSRSYSHRLIREEP